MYKNFSQKKCTIAIINKDEKYPITEKIYRRGFYLPSGQAITDYQIESVCNAINNVFNELEGYL